MSRIVDMFSSLSEVNREEELRKECRRLKETGCMVEEGERVRGRKAERAKSLTDLCES